MACPRDPVASHYSLPHYPQFRDRCLASRVAKIRYRFHPPGATAKGVSKHEQLGFRVRKRSRADGGLEPHIADQTGGNLFAASVVAAVDEAGPVRFAPRVIAVPADDRVYLALPISAETPCEQSRQRSP